MADPRQQLSQQQEVDQSTPDRSFSPPTTPAQQESQEMEQFLGPTGSRQRMETQYVVEQAGGAVPEDYTPVPTYQEAFPFELGWGEDFGRALYNEMVPANFGGLAQLGIGLGSLAFDFLDMPGVHSDISDILDGWSEGVQRWKEDNTARLSDRAMRIGPGNDEYFNLNWLAGSMGGFLGFMGAMGLDMALAGGAGSIAKLGMRGLSGGMRAATIAEQASAGSAAYGGTNTKNYLDFISRITGKTFAEGTRSARAIDRGNRIIGRAIQRKNDFISKVGNGEQWRNLSEMMSIPNIKKNYRKAINLTSASGLIYGANFEAATQAGLDSESRNMFALAATFPQAALMMIPFGSAFGKQMPKGFWGSMRNASKEATLRAAKNFAKKGSEKGIFYESVEEASKNFGNWWAPYTAKAMKAAQNIASRAKTKVSGHAAETAGVMGLISAIDALSKEMYDNYFAEAQARAGSGKFGTELLSAETGKHILESALTGALGGGLLGAMGSFAKTDKVADYSMFKEISEIKRISEENPQEAMRRVRQKLNDIDTLANNGQITPEDAKSFKAKVQEIWDTTGNELWGIEDPTGRSQWQAYNLIRTRKELANYIDIFEKQKNRKGNKQKVDKMLPELNELLAENGAINELLGELSDGKVIPGKDPRLAKIKSTVESLNKQAKGKFGANLTPEYIDYIQEAGITITLEEIRGEGAPEPVKPTAKKLRVLPLNLKKEVPTTKERRFYEETKRKPVWDRLIESGILNEKQAETLKSAFEKAPTAKNIKGFVKLAATRGKERFDSFVDTLASSNIFKPTEVENIKKKAAEFYAKDPKTAASDIATYVSRAFKGVGEKFSSSKVDDAVSDISSSFETYRPSEFFQESVPRGTSGKGLKNLGEMKSSDIGASLKEHGIEVPKSHKGKELGYIFNMAGKLMADTDIGRRMQKIARNAAEMQQRTGELAESLKNDIRTTAKEFTKEDLAELKRRLDTVNRRVEDDVNKLTKLRIKPEKNLGNLTDKQQNRLIEYFEEEIENVDDLLGFVNRNLPAKDFQAPSDVTIKDLSTAIRLKNESVRFFVKHVKEVGTLGDVPKLNDLLPDARIGDKVLHSMNYNDLNHALNSYNKERRFRNPDYKKVTDINKVSLKDLEADYLKKKRRTNRNKFNNAHYLRVGKEYQARAGANTLSAMKGKIGEKATKQMLQDWNLIHPDESRLLSDKEIVNVTNEWIRGSSLDPSYQSAKGQRVTDLYNALERSLTESDVHSFPIDLIGEQLAGGVSGIEQYVEGTKMTTKQIADELTSLGENVDQYVRDRQYTPETMQDYSWEKAGKARPYTKASDIPIHILKAVGNAIGETGLRPEEKTLRNYFGSIGQSISEWTGQSNIDTKAKLMKFFKKFYPEEANPGFKDQVKSVYEISKEDLNLAVENSQSAKTAMAEVQTMKDIEPGGDIEAFYGDKGTIIEQMFPGKKKFDLKMLIRKTTGEIPETINRNTILDALQSDAFQEAITRNMLIKHFKGQEAIKSKSPSKKEPEAEKLKGTVEDYLTRPELLKDETGLEDINELPQYIIDFSEARSRRTLSVAEGKLRKAKEKIANIKKARPDAYKKFSNDVNALEALKKKKSWTKPELAKIKELTELTDPMGIRSKIESLNIKMRSKDKAVRSSALAENIALHDRLDLANEYYNAKGLPERIDQIKADIDFFQSVEPTVDNVIDVNRFMISSAKTGPGGRVSGVFADYFKDRMFKENRGTLEDMDLPYLNKKFGVNSKLELRDMLAEHINPEYKDKPLWDIPSEEVMHLDDIIQYKTPMWEAEATGEFDVSDLSTKEIEAIGDAFGPVVKDRLFSIRKPARQVRKFEADIELSGKAKEAAEAKATELVNKYGESLPDLDKNTAIKHVTKFEDISRGKEFLGLDTDGYSRKLTDALKAFNAGEKVDVPWIRDTFTGDLKTGTLEGSRDYQFDAAERAIEKLEALAESEPYQDPKFVTVMGKDILAFIKESQMAPERKAELEDAFNSVMASQQYSNRAYKRGEWEGQMAYYQASKDGSVDPRVFEKIRENPKAFDKIVKTITAIYPNVTIREVQTILGGKKAGKAIPGKVRDAITGLVEWAVQDGRLDTIPHEFAHLYIDAFRRDPLMVKAFEQVSSSIKSKDPAIIEENLAELLGKRFTEKVLKIKKGESTWAKEYSNPLFKIGADIWGFFKRLFSAPDLHRDLRNIEQSFFRGEAPMTLHKRSLSPQYYKGYTDDMIEEHFGWKRDKSISVNPKQALGRSVDNPANVIKGLNSGNKKPVMSKFKSSLNEAIGTFGNRFDKTSISDIKGMDAAVSEKILRSIAGEDVKLSAEETGLKYNTERLLQMNEYSKEIADSYLINSSDQSHYPGIGKQMAQDIARVQAYYETISDPATKGMIKYMHSPVNLAQSHLHNVSKLLFGSDRSPGHNFIFGQFHEGNRIKDAMDGEIIKIVKQNFPSTKKISSSWNRDINSITDLNGKDLSINGGSGKMYFSDGEIAKLYLELRQDRDNIVMKEKDGATDPASGIQLDLKPVKRVKGREKKISFRLSPKEAAAIEKYVDGSKDMKKIISTMDLVMAKVHSYVNPIHTKMTGVGIPKRKNFFPRYRDVAKEVMEPQYNDLANASFAKQRKADAKSPIEIADVFDHMTAYTNNVRNYTAFSVPIRNAKKFMSSPEFQNIEFSEFLGSKAKPRIERFIDNQIKEIEDPQLLYELVRNKTFLDKMLSNFPKVALGYNVWVSTKQAASYFMANSDMDMRHLMHGVDQIPLITAKGGKHWWKKKNLKDLPEVSASLQEFMDLSPPARQRVEGSVQRQTGEVIGQDTNYLTGEDISSSWNILGKKIKVHPLLRSSRVMDWIKIVDTATIIAVWEAAKSETRSLFPKASEADMKKMAARRAEDIIMKTQPTFNSVWRTGIRREKGIFWKGLNMFTSQVTKNYNASMDSLHDYYVNGRSNKNKSKVARTVSAGFILQPLFLGGITTLQGMLYGFGSDDEGYTERTAKNALAYSTGNILGGRVIYKALSGDVKRSVEVINPLIDIFEGSATAIKHADNRSLSKNMYAMAREGTAFFGIPKSPLTMGNAILRKVSDEKK